MGLVLPRYEGTLTNWPAPVPLWQLWQWFYQLCQTVAHVHEQGWCHADIKPDNIFVRGTTLCLADWDCAIHVPSKLHPRFLASRVTTLHYASWEQLDPQSQLFHPSMDVWSLGVVALFMFQTKVVHPQPFFFQAAASEMDMMRFIQIYERCPPTLPLFVDELIRLTMQRDPLQRTTLTDLIQWIETVDLDRVEDDLHQPIV
jgi:serine/threonine protein kinase